MVDLVAAGIAVSLTDQPTLNALMASGRDVRAEVGELLVGAAREDVLHPIEECEVLLPFEVADYVDSYSSIHHATNLGRILRPDSEPLMPNWRHIPVAYHGRAGSVVVSGTPVPRPIGMLPGEGTPASGPSRSLDIELEVGTVVGRGGTRIAPDDSDAHVFGFVLLNDWSARDIQAYEYQPLGPNLGEELRDDDLSVGRDPRRAAAVPRRSASPGSARRSVPSGDAAVGARRHARGVAQRHPSVPHWTSPTCTGRSLSSSPT